MTTPHFKAEIDPRPGNDSVATFKPRALNIIWGNDRRYWHLRDSENEPAELVQVSWLEVTGSALLDGGKDYEISFSVQLRQDAFGWSGCPIFLMAKVGKSGRYKWKKIGPLDNYPRETRFQIPESTDALTITVPAGSDKQTVYFGLYEVWSGKWKGGLEIYEANIKAVNRSAASG